MYPRPWTHMKSQTVILITEVDPIHNADDQLAKKGPGPVLLNRKERSHRSCRPVVLKVADLELA